VAGRGADFQRTAAELDAIAVMERAVGARGAGRFRKSDIATQLLLQEPRAGHVVGMDVGVQRPQQFQPQFADQRRVAADLLEHRIDQDGFARNRAAQQVGVGRGGRVEELAEDEHGLL
jgi:hypothetical protein